jgi:hypothetical protein
MIQQASTALCKLWSFASLYQFQISEECITLSTFLLESTGKLGTTAQHCTALWDISRWKKGYINKCDLINQHSVSKWRQECQSLPSVSSEPHHSRLCHGYSRQTYLSWGSPSIQKWTSARAFKSPPSAFQSPVIFDTAISLLAKNNGCNVFVCFLYVLLF